MRERQREYTKSCDAKALWPVSSLAAIAASNVNDRQDRWPWFVLVAAGLILAFAFAVRQRRRRRPQRDDPPVMGRLQVRFRLIDKDRELRQLARTGAVRGSQLRYACP